MTTKQAVIASVISIVVILVLGIGLAFMLIPMDGPQAAERAGRFGSGVGIVAVIPSAFIWFKWAMARRQEREKPKKKRRA